MNQFSKDLAYQEVIGRSPRLLSFSKSEIDRLSGERILVTGAGGSIGSRIIYFLAQIPGLVYMATDRDETALHSLSLELNSTALFDNPNLYLLDIRDKEGVDKAIGEFRPTLVVHAAALKHLSTLEKQPREAVLTNIFGTANVIEASLCFGVKRFVNISTDKAVNPKSVLGKSKRMSEIYSFGFQNPLFANSVRFGNVFNSRGSVIETFAHQILSGKPITLTTSTISRFFMHTDEAAQLTIKSFLLPKSDIYVFDMGEPIKLIDIVKNMQKILGGSSSIVITGLRDGEKENEELTFPYESIEKSEESLIYRVKFNIPKLLVNDISDQIRNRNFDYFREIDSELFFENEIK